MKLDGSYYKPATGKCPAGSPGWPDVWRCRCIPVVQAACPSQTARNRSKAAGEQCAACALDAARNASSPHSKLLADYHCSNVTFLRELCANFSHVQPVTTDFDAEIAG